jgi:hypothetical protein
VNFYFILTRNAPWYDDENAMVWWWKHDGKIAMVRWRKHDIISRFHHRTITFSPSYNRAIVFSLLEKKFYIHRGMLM